MKAIYAALVKAQKGFGPALKSSTNPHFRSKYADLSACIEAVIDSLNDNGVMLMQKTHEVENGVMIETVFLHESGEELSAGKLFMPATKIDAQGFGSALSYARRYSLMAACGIAPEDDDANNAVKSAPPPKPTPKPATPPVQVATPPVQIATPPVQIESAPVQIPPTPVQAAPPKMQGKADQWQLKVSTDPGTDFAQWAEMVKDATVFMLEMAQTKDDTMNIFRTNRNIYDKLQADDLASYDALTNIFKTYKEKL
jgi:hypothetical protein